MKMNKKVAALGGLVALAAVGGTWAYFSQTAAITNPFNTGSYSGSIVEHFNPGDGDNWKPGAFVSKEVKATNTGTQDLLVRVMMDEAWTRTNTEEGTTTDIIDHHSSEGDKFTNPDQINPEDGLVDGDDTVVNKDLVLDRGWIFNEADGYWYWNAVLPAGQSTTNLLNGVALAADADMGLYETTYWYAYSTNKNAKPDELTWQKLGAIADPAKAAEQLKDKAAATESEEGEYAGQEFFSKSESKLKTGYEGYAAANYDLMITTEFIQATDAAVEAEWANAPASIKDLLNSTTTE